MARKFYLTTPIYYVNDQPHIGHTYTTVVADVVARFHRMLGQDVHFLTGTDEHGQKIERAAQAKGLRPIDLADGVVERFRGLWRTLGITNDVFIRTTEERHRRGVEKHILSALFDALSNYITALGYGTDRKLYARYWPADMHLVGKDILRFHAVYWPAYLMSAGEPLPRRVVAHGWWLRDAAKISKSKGGVVDPIPLIEAFGADPVRYFLLREMIFGQDANYSDEAFIDRVNTDLANDLGNLASRTLKMIEDYCGGKTP